MTNKTEQPCKSCGVPVFTANCWLVCPFKKYEEYKALKGLSDEKEAHNE